MLTMNAIKATFLALGVGIAMAAASAPAFATVNQNAPECTIEVCQTLEVCSYGHCVSSKSCTTNPC